MPTYLVERYLPGRNRAWLEAALARLRGQRTRAAYLGSTYVPEDDSCFCRFEAETPDEEVVTYDSPSELVEKVRHYVAHPDERRAIAAAGQRRTLAEHTYRHRMEQLDALLRTRLG